MEEKRTPSSYLLENPKKRSLSLNTFFTFILISALLLLSAVASLVYYRLTEFQMILDDITDKSIPALVHSNKVNSQVSSLTYLIEGLTQASSQASRRIAEQDIDNNVKDILTLIDNSEKDDYLAIHIESIATELDDLNQLIKQKLQFETQITQQKLIMYQLYKEVMQYMLNNDDKNAQTPATYLWTIELADVVTTSSEAITLTRMNQIRQISSKVHALLASQQQKIGQLPILSQSRANETIVQLREVLLGEQGLITMRMEQLKITGRAIGRGHFVRNLVNDLSNLVEYQSAKLNDAIQHETQQTNQQVKQQIRLMGLMSLLAGVFLLAIMFLIRQRVVKRLEILNKKVRGRISGGNEALFIQGNDEITDIARSFNYVVDTIEQQKQKLQELSLTDSLTGIANRRALDQRLSNSLQSALRHQWPLSVLLLDVDYFKAYNDNYGHAKGDKCLKEIAYVLSSNKRRNEDFVARYGGEEFIYLLPQSDEQGAIHIAELILTAIIEQKIPHLFSEAAPYVTVSIGIATFSPEQPISAEQLLKNADLALYQAKSQGRNQFFCFSPQTSLE
ncbi:diguanylate cyclase domain-containing protein [Neptunicella sp.]|uniref:diguanylate cyclase domain-containing protein n=1 Tax=Neptunicella sp. TaxID=2125986 RepID=UPI003F69419A